MLVTPRLGPSYPVFPICSFNFFILWNFSTYYQLNVGTFKLQTSQNTCNCTYTINYKEVLYNGNVPTLEPFIVIYKTHRSIAIQFHKFVSEICTFIHLIAEFLTMEPKFAKTIHFVFVIISTAARVKNLPQSISKLRPIVISKPQINVSALERFVN